MEARRMSGNEINKHLTMYYGKPLVIGMKNTDFTINA